MEKTAHERGAALVAMIDGLERYRNTDRARSIDAWADDKGHSLEKVIEGLKFSLVEEAIVIAEETGLAAEVAS